MEDKKGITNTNAFQKMFNEADFKPNKIWVDKRSEFYNSSIKSWLEDNDTEMYSQKCVVAEVFFRTSNRKIYEYMISISKNMYNTLICTLINRTTHIIAQSK